jgi:formamidopyrimidine-DNA glycosylase
MNQKRIAGIGNIYSDEILYNAKIYPGSKCSELSDKEIARLYSNMRKVLKRAIQDKADPEKMPRTYLIGHRKDNTECPRCGGRIKKTSFSGRGAYFCGKCQAKT